MHSFVSFFFYPLTPSPPHRIIPSCSLPFPSPCSTTDRRLPPLPTSSREGRAWVSLVSHSQYPARFSAPLHDFTSLTLVAPLGEAGRPTKTTKTLLRSRAYPTVSRFCSCCSFLSHTFFNLPFRRTPIARFSTPTFLFLLAKLTGLRGEAEVSLARSPSAATLHTFAYGHTNLRQHGLILSDPVGVLAIC